MVRGRRGLILFGVLLLSAGSALGGKYDLKKLFPTVRGSSGMFNVMQAYTLRKGEFTFQVNAHLINREPGDISIMNYPVSFSFGVSDRVEVFASWELHKRVRHGEIIEFQNGPLSNPGPTILSSGAPGSFNDTPYKDVSFGNASGDLWIGFKGNIWSDRRGDPISIAFQPMVRMKTKATRSQARLRGLTADSFDVGIVGVVSKDLPRGTFSAHVGPMFAENPLNADRQHWLDWGFGFDVPLGDLRSRTVSVVTEFYSQKWFGDKRFPNTNARSPVDFYAGLRGYLGKNIALSGGYNITLNRVDPLKTRIPATDRHGFIAQLAFARKINRPPTIQCSPSSTSVVVGESATLQATYDDEDDDFLNLSWTSASGQLTEQGDSAVFNSSGLAYDQTYSVKAEVTDSEGAVASCSVDIAVTKNKIAPVINCGSAATVQKGQSVTLNAPATDENGDALTYSWSVDGQSVPNNSSSFEFGTAGAGRDVGTHTVSVTVTDVDGMTDTCTITVTVTAIPQGGCTVALNLDRNQVMAGQAVTATARGSDSDPGDSIASYRWTVDNQRRSESGATLRIDTTDLAAGAHSVRVECVDSRGGTGQAAASFNVTVAKSYLSPLTNDTKLELEDIVVLMNNDPQVRARITGHTDSRGSEEANQRVGLRRAEEVRDWLVEKGIDAGRIDVESKGEGEPVGDNETAEGRKQNRRVEIQLYVR